MRLQQKPCNRDEIEEVVRLVLGHPTSPYVHHPTLFINAATKLGGSPCKRTDGNDDNGPRADSTPRRGESREETDNIEQPETRETKGIQEVPIVTRPNSDCTKKSCNEYFDWWMNQHSIDFGSPHAVVIETYPLKVLLDHYDGAFPSNKSNKITEDATLVMKRYRQSGILPSEIPLGERAVYLCAQRAVEQQVCQEQDMTTAKSIFPQLFLPLFVTTIDMEDVRETVNNSNTSAATKKRKKSSVTSAATKQLKPSASAPDFNVATSSSTITAGGIMSEPAHVAGSWPNLRAEGPSPRTGASTLLNPPASPPPNTVVMAKYRGSLTALLALKARSSPLDPLEFAKAFEPNSVVYCRELYRQPVLELKALASILYLITRGLIQIHNIAQGQTASPDDDSPSATPYPETPIEELVGFVHNDLRLPNILLADDGNVGLVDFELASPIILDQRGHPRLADSKKWQEEVGHFYDKFVGFAYLPPDNTPCDVWTLGIVALDLMTGCHTFFKGENPLQRDAQRWSDGPTPMKLEVNKRLETLCHMKETNTSHSSPTSSNMSDQSSIISIEEGTPLEGFLSECFMWATSEEPALRLRKLHHPKEGVCANGCLCTHELFTSTLQVTPGVSMEEEAKATIQSYFLTPSASESDSTPSAFS